MKNIFITFLFVCISFTIAFSQQKAKIEISKPYPVVDAKTKIYLRNDENILALKDNTVQLLGIDKMNLAKISEFSLPKGAEFEEICEFDGKHILFYSLWDKQNETEQLFYKEINIEKGNINDEGKLLFKVKGKVTGLLLAGGFYSYRVVNKFNFQYSFADSKLMIQYRLKPEERKDELNYDIIGFYVLGKGMEKAWSKEIKMPYTEKKMDNLDYSVDAQGNAYILAKIFDDNTTKNKTKDDKPNYHLELLRIEKESGTITKTPISMAGKFISKLWIYESTEDYMICTGFTNKGIDVDDADGITLFKISKDGAISDMKNYPIPLDILNQYVSEKTKKRNEKKEKDDKAEFQELELRQLRVQADGSIIIVGEQHYIVAHTSYSNGRSYTYYTYHYNDMLITKIDKSGELAWMKKLPKRQTGKAGIGGMSYSYMLGDGCHYLMFLDNVKNMDLTVNDFPDGHTDGAGGYLTAYKVNDGDGKVSKISILDTRNVKDDLEIFQFAVNRIIPISLNSFIFESYKKKKEDILIKVTF